MSFEVYKQVKKEEECNPPKTQILRGKPKKKREERATYKSTRGLRAENIKRDNNGEAIIKANRLAIYY